MNKHGLRFDDWLARKSNTLLIPEADEILYLSVIVNDHIKLALTRVTRAELAKLSGKHPGLLSIPAFFCTIPDKNGISISVWPIPDKNYKIAGVGAPQKSALFQ